MYVRAGLCQDVSRPADSRAGEPHRACSRAGCTSRGRPRSSAVGAGSLRRHRACGKARPARRGRSRRAAVVLRREAAGVGVVVADRPALGDGVLLDDVDEPAAALRRPRVPGHDVRARLRDRIRPRRAASPRSMLGIEWAASTHGDPEARALALDDRGQLAVVGRHTRSSRSSSSRTVSRRESAGSPSLVVRQTRP